MSTGLKNKYIISRTDGKPMHPEFTGFVLRLDEYTDPEFRDAGIAAIIAFSEVIESTHPILAKDLRDKYDDRHDWRLEDTGLYNTTYVCNRCGEPFIEQSSNPYSFRPVNGCKSRQG